MNNIKFDEYDLDLETADVVEIESKYILDGATSLNEAIQLLEAYIGYLEELQTNGFELEDVITQGQGTASLDVILTEELF